MPQSRREQGNSKQDTPRELHQKANGGWGRNQERGDDNDVVGDDAGSAMVMVVVMPHALKTNTMKWRSGNVVMW